MNDIFVRMRVVDIASFNHRIVAAKLWYKARLGLPAGYKPETTTDG